MVLKEFSDKDIEDVWRKGQVIQGYNSDNYRKDQCGAWISRSAYGNRQSKFGWEIDHINPNGDDSLSNLRPLHWKNNASRQDGRLTCPVTSNGNDNIGV